MTEQLSTQHTKHDASCVVFIDAHQQEEKVSFYFQFAKTEVRFCQSFSMSRTVSPDFSFSFVNYGLLILEITLFDLLMLSQHCIFGICPTESLLLSSLYIVGFAFICY